MKRKTPNRPSRSKWREKTKDRKHGKEYRERENTEVSENMIKKSDKRHEKEVREKEKERKRVSKKTEIERKMYS